MLNPDLLKLLACPACDDRPPVRQDGDTLVCDQCGRVYPIKDGIPELIVESAIGPKGPDQINATGATA
ncbi:MAG: Trm112 family protein [Chthonomonadales bacterium]